MPNATTHCANDDGYAAHAHPRCAAPTGPSSTPCTSSTREQDATRPVSADNTLLSLLSVVSSAGSGPRMGSRRTQGRVCALQSREAAPKWRMSDVGRQSQTN